ncbi:MAG: Acyl-[acyl-carrier-protein]--UDP-N-acetylglucosamine O-acyltransferase [Verrucomicrobiota bacterium]
MIHPSALVHPAAQVDPSAEIGPFAIVEAGAIVGAGCRLAAHAILKAGAVLGAGVVVDHFAVVGGDPQDLSFDPSTASRVTVGARTVIREHVTLHRATKPDTATVIGADCLLMAGSHVAHDCVLGDGVILANGCMLGGHVHVGAKAFVSGGVAVHQFCRIGGGSLTSGNAVITEDVPPDGLAHGRNELAGLNLVGLRRRGVPAEAIAELKRAYHAVYRPGQGCAALAQAELAGGAYRTAEGRAFLEFFLGGKRGRFVQPS